MFESMSVCHELSRVRFVQWFTLGIPVPKVLARPIGSRVCSLFTSGGLPAIPTPYRKVPVCPEAWSSVL